MRPRVTSDSDEVYASVEAVPTGALVAQPARELVAFLHSCGAGSLDHSGRTLMAHLLGTFEVLVRWGCEPYVCNAGLFHSVYSTGAFHEKLVELDKRDTVSALLGTRSEQLVHFFCTTDLDFITTLIQTGPPYNVPSRVSDFSVTLDQKGLTDLALIKWANVIEQAPYTSLTNDQKNWLREDAELCAELLPERARHALEYFLGSS